MVYGLWVMVDNLWFMGYSRWFMTKCLRPNADLDDLTTYDLTTFTTARLLIDLRNLFAILWLFLTFALSILELSQSDKVSRSIASRESREVVSREVVEVVMGSQALCHIEFLEWNQRSIRNSNYREPPHYSHLPQHDT